MNSKNVDVPETWTLKKKIFFENHFSKMSRVARLAIGRTVVIDNETYSIVAQYGDLFRALALSVSCDSIRSARWIRRKDLMKIPIEDDGKNFTEVVNDFKEPEQQDESGEAEDVQAIDESSDEEEDFDEENDDDRAFIAPSDESEESDTPLLHRKRRIKVEDFEEQEEDEELDADVDLVDVDSNHSSSPPATETLEVEDLEDLTEDDDICYPPSPP